MIVGLLGGPDISKYSIADVLWEKISDLSGIKFGFKFIPIGDFTDLCRFYWDFYENKDLIGFNIALPWKKDMVNLVDFIDSEAKVFNSINVVYRKNGLVRSSNTDVIGLEKSLINTARTLPKSKVLILGAGGAGLPSAIYLMRKYNCNVSIYDVQELSWVPPGVNCVKKYSDITNNVYDFIINATPVGKYYLDRIPEQFSLPVSIDILDKVTNGNSVILDMNPFPFHTELLKFSKLKNLVFVSGIDVLVYQALESMKLYTGYIFTEGQERNLISYMEQYSKNKENELLR